MTTSVHIRNSFIYLLHVLHFLTKVRPFHLEPLISTEMLIDSTVWMFIKALICIACFTLSSGPIPILLWWRVMVVIEEPIKIMLDTLRLGIWHGRRANHWFQVIHLYRLKVNSQLIILLQELLIYGLS